MFPDDVSITRPGGKWRTRLRMGDGSIVSVVIGRPIQRKRAIYWRIDPTGEREFVTLLARLDKECIAFLDFHVFPRIDRRDRFFVSQADPWLNRGEPLTDLLAFCEVVAKVAGGPQEQFVSDCPLLPN